MSAIQTTERIVFGTASQFNILPGGVLQRSQNMTELMADFKAELKEAFSEPGYPIAVADGHRSIDITAKSYNLNPQIMADALGGAVTTGSTEAFAIDEPHTVPAVSTYTVTLSNIPIDAGKLLVIAFPLTGSIPTPKVYSIVTAGTETAGSSCSVVASTGVLTFAAGDASVLVNVSYGYNQSVGSRVLVTNLPQNSSKTSQLIAVKRDGSPVDNSTAQSITTFFAVKSAGLKSQYKENDFTVYERMYKAFADSRGYVVQTDFVNV